MENNAGKITFTYVSKVIIWTLVIGFVAGFALLFIVAGSIEGIDENSLEDLTGVFNSLLIGLFVVEILTILLSCKLATSKIKKKYEINDSNRPGVIKNITIFLVIWAVLIVVLNMAVRSGVNTLFEEANDDLDTIDSYSDILTDEEEEDVETVEDFLGFVNTMTIVLVVVNAAVVLLMIPLERKWLADSTSSKEEKKEE